MRRPPSIRALFEPGISVTADNHHAIIGLSPLSLGCPRFSNEGALSENLICR